MDTLQTVSWGLLALVHLSPAAVVAAPSLIQRLYGMSPSGDVGLLLRHRGVLFLAILAACLWAIVDPPARRGLSLVVAISVVGFLILYVRAGAPRGPLRTVALADALALAPLAVVIAAAWRVPTA